MGPCLPSRVLGEEMCDRDASPVVPQMGYAVDCLQSSRTKGYLAGSVPARFARDLKSLLERSDCRLVSVLAKILFRWVRAV